VGMSMTRKLGILMVGSLRERLSRIFLTIGSALNVVWARTCSSRWISDHAAFAMMRGECKVNELF
jgi:hypothetical protein